MLISALLIMSLLFGVTVYAAKSKNPNENSQADTKVTLSQSFSQIEKSTEKESEKAALNKSEKETVTAELTSTAKAYSEGTEAVTDGKTKHETSKNKQKKSKLINGFNAVQSWSVSDGSSSVYAEKIALELNVYKNGKMTSDTVTRYGYFAVVKTDKSAVHMVTAKSTVNKTVSDVVSISKKYGALISVNNEMCNHDLSSYNGFYNAANDQTNATVIKESMPAQIGLATPSLAVYEDGTWQYPVSVSADNYSALINSGVKNTVGYTYPLIWNGEPYKLPDTGSISSIWYDHDLTPSRKGFYNDHTVIGQIDADTYVLAVSEGFGQAYLAEYMLNNLGVQNAYWGNGGHCSLMYIRGYGAVNRPDDKNLCLTADVFCVK